jgi:hypothetical protein
MAETLTVTQEASYVVPLTEDASQTGQVGCMARAKQLALEGAGSILTSDLTLHTDETSGKLTQQAQADIHSFYAVIVKAHLLSYDEGATDENGHAVASCTVEVSFDPDEMRTLQERLYDQGLRQAVTSEEKKIAELETELRSVSASIAAGRDSGDTALAANSGFAQRPALDPTGGPRPDGRTDQRPDTSPVPKLVAIAMGLAGVASLAKFALKLVFSLFKIGIFLTGLVLLTKCLALAGGF